LKLQVAAHRADGSKFLANVENGLCLAEITAAVTSVLGLMANIRRMERPIAARLAKCKNHSP
jgi:hypothetical protein